MKFIFPQNYTFKSKLFGTIDYSTAILNIVWYSIVGLVLSLLMFNIKIKIFIFIFLCFPLLLFSIVGFNGENVLYVIKYMFKYFTRPKVYVFKKVTRKIL